MKLSIDPGKFKVAYALWRDDGALGYAGLVQAKTFAFLPRAESWKVVAEHFWRTLDMATDLEVIVEIPQVYDGPQEEDRNDLIDLAGVVGAIVANKRVDSVIWSPLPREWKGQLPKEITQKRVDQKLSDEEKKRIIWPAKSLRHNTYDAIHLGLTYLEKKGLRQAKG
jgi:hypothetical protein